METWRPLAIAAATAVVVGFIGSALLGGSDGLPIGTGSGTRVEAVAPKGGVEIARINQFEWSGTTGAVRLVVVDATHGGKPIIDQTVEGTRYQMTDAEKTRLKPGSAYQWFVEYKARDGEKRTAPAARFEIDD